MRGFGEGEGPIYISQVRCDGTEDNFLQCAYSNSTSLCTHSLDAGIRCAGMQLMFYSTMHIISLDNKTYWGGRGN